MSGTPHQGHEARFENLLKLLKRDGESEGELAGRVIYRTKDDGAASSPHAGISYLVRQAIRAGWTPATRNLRDALAVLRPYRFGPADEPIAALFERIQRDIGIQSESADLEDIEESMGRSKAIDADGLARLLANGLDVLHEAGDSKWDLLRTRVLDPAGEDRVVLFAQPIETVTAVARYLERIYGRSPAVIIGGQTDQARQAEIDRFWRPDGPRFLVSSRAGGEGINLQVARRLVHIDVPWNPMELEQRVGRIHRFGSRETVLVDTLVMRHSREEEMYAVADRKLRLIASTMVEPDRANALFSRVMCLIPPEDLQTILLRDAPGQAPLDAEGIGRLVQQGFAKWKAFHDKYSAEQQKIRQLDPGLAAWEDVDEFLAEHAGARPMGGFWVQRFARFDDEVRLVKSDARVITFDGSTPHACGDYAGTPVFGPDGVAASQLG